MLALLRSMTVLMVAGLSAQLCAADGFQLSGVILDPNRAPVSGVKVSLAVAGISTTTDAQGWWSISNTTRITPQREMRRIRQGNLSVEDGRLHLRYSGHDATGRRLSAIPSYAVPADFGAGRLAALGSDTLLFRWGTKSMRLPLISNTMSPADTAIIDTAASTHLLLRTTRFSYGVIKALGLSLMNLDTCAYDSLRIRLFLNGTAAEVADFAASINFVLEYRVDGIRSLDPATYSLVKKSRPKLVDPSCPATSQCAWAFDLPLLGATLQPETRWQLDLVFPRHLLERDSTELLKLPATHDPYAGSDWSFRKHDAGGDNGSSPVAYEGIPETTPNGIEEKLLKLPLNPYIAVYSRDRLVQGIAP